MKIVVNQSFCPQNHNCPATRMCPVGAIEQQSPFHAPSINYEKCTGCGACTNVCRTFAKA